MLYPDATIQSQYAASPTITALVEGFNAQIDPRSEVQLFFDKIFNPRTAEGVGLDIWARIVGVERNIYVEEMGSNFGFFITGGSPTSETYAIPSAIQSLTGYGWSAGGVCNEIDFERKVYIQRVASVDLGTLTWLIGQGWGTAGFFSQTFSTLGAKYPATNAEAGNILCAAYATTSRNGVVDTSEDKVIGVASTGALALRDIQYSTTADLTAALSGVILLYELAEPVETDISAYISSTPSLSVEPNTALTFANSNGNDYHIPVPSTITYTAGGESITDDTTAYAKPIGSVQGNVSIESIGGKTLVWNSWFDQIAGIASLAQRGITLVDNEDGSATFSGTCTESYNNTLTFRRAGSAKGEKQGEKWFVRLRGNPGIKFGISGAGAIAHTTAEYKIQTIVTATTTIGIGCTYTAGETYSGTVWPCIINLTQMFGAGNEPTDADAVNAMFPANFYEADTGSLLSAGVTGIEYTKRQVIEQEWEPWDQGVFYSPDTVQRGSYRIDDTAFRKFIFWKALANISTADCYTLNRLLTKLFDNPVIVTETGTMQIRMTTTKPLADWQKAVLVQYGLFGKPAGVGYEFWTILTPVLGFVRDGENYMPLGQAPFFSGVMNSDFGGN